MKIINSYSILRSALSVEHAHPIFRGWEYTDTDLALWFQNAAATGQLETTERYCSNVAQLVLQIEEHFGRALPGELVLIPSMGEIDGFARYDRGHHTVFLGVDFPEASMEYLQALTAHELSHVYRDHSPNVWGFLGKPLADITRKEYLDNTSAREHLVSEGLAVLNSQAVFPEIPKRFHHFYDASEMEWCEKNDSVIDRALSKCMSERDPNPWKFYAPSSVASGSPAHVHYYWAAKKIGEWLEKHPNLTLVQAHEMPADEVRAF